MELDQNTTLMFFIIIVLAGFMVLVITTIQLYKNFRDIKSQDDNILSDAIINLNQWFDDKLHKD